MQNIVKSELYGLEYIEASIADLTVAANYLTKTELEQLVDACYFSAFAHNNQKRRSGEPYICHPIKVSEILAHEVQFILPVLQAAVLHDVIEDTQYSKQEIIERFGSEVAELVDGVSKLEKNNELSPELLQAKTFTKFVQAIEKDPRVVMIKFADRMHNMLTLDALPVHKRQRIANETLDIYVPIAMRLGMYMFKTELEELAFKHVNPWRYRIIEKIILENPTRIQAANEVIDFLSNILKNHGINATIRKRRRNLMNVYRKLQKNASNRRPLENASIPFIVITQTVDDCYRILGLIHEHYRPVFKKLTDYIASPKVNGYQSIHTSVLTDERRVINFQIRTQEMHAIAEAGLIAIWRQHNQELLNDNTKPKDKSIRRWLGGIKNLQSLINDPLDYYQSVKRDLSGFDLQVFSPKGDTIALPQGSTVIDFAYHIHRDVGNRMISAKVNNVDVPINYVLENGQTVEILTDIAAHPRVFWLKNIKTARARAAIRHFFNNIPVKDLIIIGRAAFKDFTTSKGYHFNFIESNLKKYCRNKKVKLDKMYTDIALDDIRKTKLLTEILTVNVPKNLIYQVTILTYNCPGSLASISDIIAKSSVNIESITLPEHHDSKEVNIAFLLSLSMLEQLTTLITKLSALDIIKSITYEERT